MNHRLAIAVVLALMLGACASTDTRYAGGHGYYGPAYDGYDDSYYNDPQYIVGPQYAPYWDNSYSYGIVYPGYGYGYGGGYYGGGYYDPWGYGGYYNPWWYGGGYGNHYRHHDHDHDGDDRGPGSSHFGDGRNDREHHQLQAHINTFGLPINRGDDSSGRRRDVFGGQQQQFQPRPSTNPEPRHEPRREHPQRQRRPE